MALPLPPELCRYVYDFIHPIKEFRKFQDALQERVQLLIQLEEATDSSRELDYLHLEDIGTNSEHLDEIGTQLEKASLQIQKKQNILLRLKEIGRLVETFYQENPKMIRPLNINEMTEHQYRLYWTTEFSPFHLKRMENNISISRGLWTEDDKIIYDDLHLILTQGTIRDLRYHCKINGIRVPSRLKSQPQNQNETIQFRKELVQLVKSF